MPPISNPKMDAAEAELPKWPVAIKQREYIRCRTRERSGERNQRPGSPVSCIANEFALRRTESTNAMTSDRNKAPAAMYTGNIGMRNLMGLPFMPPILPRMKNPGSAVEALAGECNKATRSQVVLKHRTVFATTVQNRTAAAWGQC